jgi:type II secretory pathway pseudopilin PulG
MLVVIAIIGILAASILSALSVAKAKAHRLTCMNDLKQIATATRLYMDDSSDVTPQMAYNEKVRQYLGLHGPPLPQDKIFACPDDTFFYYPDQKNDQVYFTNSPRHESKNKKYSYSSYSFNMWLQQLRITTNVSGSNITTTISDVGGIKLSSISEPAKTLFILEAPAYGHYSWHDPKESLRVSSHYPTNRWPDINNARDMAVFVDTHSSYIKFYSGTNTTGRTRNPPPSYEYKWSAD